MKRPIAELINNVDGYEIGLLCPTEIGQKLDNSYHFSTSVKRAKIHTYSTMKLPFVSYEWPVPLPLFYFKAFKIFKEYDVVHMWVYFYMSSFWITFAKLFFPRTKLILTIDTFPGESFSSGKVFDSLFKIYHAVFGWFVFGIPNTITLYGKSLIPYAKKLGIQLKKTKVAPTGINTGKFDGPYKDIRKEFNIKKDEIVLLFVGLLLPRKGIDIIIKTISRLRNKRVKMILVGDGPDKKRYENMAKRYQLQDKIIFTGFRKDVKNFYRSSDIFFFPSRGEGLAGVIMEAMTCGLPVVTSNIPCTPDLVKNQENGFLCASESAKDYAFLLNNLIEDNKTRTRFGAQSKKSIKSFNWEKSIQNFERLYCNVRHKRV